jgi:hypothetical protein
MIRDEKVFEGLRRSSFSAKRWWPCTPASTQYDVRNFVKSHPAFVLSHRLDSFSHGGGGGDAENLAVGPELV